MEDRIFRKIPTIGIIQFGSICAIYTFLLFPKSTRSVSLGKRGQCTIEKRGQCTIGKRGQCTIEKRGQCPLRMTNKIREN